MVKNSINAGLREELKNFKGSWHSPIDFGNGVNTAGWAVQRRFARRLKHMRLPDDMTDMRVLDIGAWDGFFSFEFERRGAKVLAVDVWTEPMMEKFLFARGKLNSKIEYKRLDVHDLDSALMGKFDMVFCAGVLYHLRYPLMALERIRSVTEGFLVLETSALLPFMHERFPMIGFFPGDREAKAAGTKWGISGAATISWLEAALYAAGFSRVEIKYTPSFRWWHKFMALATNSPRGGRVILHAFTR